MELIRSDEHYKALDKLAAEVINVTTHSALNFDDREENVDMCKALDDMRKEATEQAMRSLKMPESDFDKYLLKL